MSTNAESNLISSSASLNNQDKQTDDKSTPAQAQQHQEQQEQSNHHHHLYHHHAKREPAHRVFVNRSLSLSKIKFYGFDMDYTLALYKSPQYEVLAFKLVIDQLVKMGYPTDIQNFVYDPSFPVRGLWYDKLYGNLLKMDSYGNILVCVHGFKFMKSSEIYKLYPNKYLNFDESRVYVLNTLFSLPEIYLLACLINYFTTSPHFERSDTGVRCGDIFVSFKAIFQDVRFAIDYVHIHGDLKRLTVENLEEYVVKDDRLPLLFDRMHENNVKVFLLTNSGFDYTDKIMGFLLNDEKAGRNWRMFFDYIVVDAKKPLFFAEGTSLKEVDINTGMQKFGSHAGPLKLNMVYSGGSVDVFSKLIGSHGKDVLYVGDHIFGDIIKSKKERAWRTFLVVPELSQELIVWHEKRNVFAEVERLDKILCEKLVDLDSSSKTCPNISGLKHQIQKCIHEMDMEYGLLGSLFRSGSRQTHFASQATRFADIYAASHLNLLHYPFFYLFKAPPVLMAHESTVNPYEHISDQAFMKKHSRGSIAADSLPLNDLVAMNAATAAKLNEKLGSIVNNKISPLTDTNRNIYFGSSVSTTSTTTVSVTPQTITKETTDTNEIKLNESKEQLNLVKPMQPSELTHHEDFDDDDEDSDESKSTPPISAN